MSKPLVQRHGVPFRPSSTVHCPFLPSIPSSIPSILPLSTHSSSIPSIPFIPFHSTPFQSIGSSFHYSVSDLPSVGLPSLHPSVNWYSKYTHTLLIPSSMISSIPWWSCFVSLGDSVPSLVPELIKLINAYLYRDLDVSRSISRSSSVVRIPGRQIQSVKFWVTQMLRKPPHETDRLRYSWKILQ